MPSQVVSPSGALGSDGSQNCIRMEISGRFAHPPVMFPSTKLNQIMEGKKGIIFDLDGTLIDSLGIWAEVDRIFFKKRNIEFDYKEYLNAIAGMSLDSTAVYTIERYKLKESQASIIQEWKETYKELIVKVQFFSGARELLSVLAEH